MRITEYEKNQITKVAQDIFDKNISIYLFGSRADDNKKGGDIDLYIKTNQNLTLEEKLNKKVKFTIRLINLIGDQKIDIIINDNTDNKLIYKIAEQEGIKLC